MKYESLEDLERRTKKPYTGPAIFGGQPITIKPNRLLPKSSPKTLASTSKGWIAAFLIDVEIHEKVI